MWLFPYVLCNISKVKRGKGNMTEDMLFGVYIVDVKGQKQCFAPNDKLFNFRANYAPDFGNSCFNVSRSLFSCLSPQHIQGGFQENRSKFPYTGTCHFISHSRIPWRLVPQGNNLNLATTKFLLNFYSVHMQPLGYHLILPASAWCNNGSSPPLAPCSGQTERSPKIVCLVYHRGSKRPSWCSPKHREIWRVTQAWRRVCFRTCPGASGDAAHPSDLFSSSCRARRRTGL